MFSVKGSSLVWGSGVGSSLPAGLLVDVSDEHE